MIKRNKNIGYKKYPSIQNMVLLDLSLFSGVVWKKNKHPNSVDTVVQFGKDIHEAVLLVVSQYYIKAYSECFLDHH